MVVDHQIICLSDSHWDSGMSGRQQISARLARYNDVWYVNPPPSLRCALADVVRSPWRKPTSMVGERLHIVDFPGYLGRSYRLHLEEWLRDYRVRRLRRQILHGGRKPTILLAFHPTAWPYVKCFPDVPVVYHVYDNYTAMAGTEETAIRIWDVHLTERADLVCAVTEGLAAERRARARQLHVLPNGADYDLFARPDYPEPADLAGIPRPRICLVARLGTHIDYTLLHSIVRRRPWALVMVGPRRPMPPEQEQQFWELVRHPHVHWLGEKTHTDVAAYTCHADVCICPYRLTAVTSVGSPLKLFEYFAAGKPVVATQLSAMQPVAPLIRFAAGAADWEEQLIQALDSDCRVLQEQRQMAALEYSWDAVVERMSHLIWSALQSAHV